MKKIFYSSLILTLIVSFSGVPVAKAQTASQPNVLMIMADDLGYYDIEPAPYGSTFIKTPNLKQLRSQGMAFDNYYSYPICSEARMAFLTGMNSASNGLRVNCDDPTQRGIPEGVTSLPQRLREGGYSTYHVGKWHLGYLNEFSPVSRGFDYSFRMIALKDYYSTYQENLNPIVQSDKHATALYGGKVNSLIKQHVAQAPGKPFFINYWANEAHSPLNPTEHWLSQYPDTTTKSRYAALISGLDNQIGKILSTLDELGIANNTIVMFVSDNGTNLKKHEDYGNGNLRGAKFTAFEGGIKSPLIIRWPNVIQPNLLNTSILQVTDIYPTLLDVAGIGSHGLTLEGTSFKNVLYNNVVVGQDKEIFRDHGTASFISRSLRVNEWKYVYDKQTEYLFHIPSDVGETVDYKSQYADIFNRLKARFNEIRLQNAKINLQPIIKIADSSNRMRFAAGQTQFQKYSHNTMLNPSRYEFSAGMWIKPSGSSTKKMVVLRKGESYTLAITNSYLEFIWTNSNGVKTKIRSTERVLDNQWNYISISLDRTTTSQAILSVNGTNNVFPYDGTQYTYEALFVGKANEVANHFIGQIQSLELFNATLSAEEISANRLRETAPRD
jgi:arylsulfatase A-like enzyme